MELGPREIADYGEVIDWVAAQQWSNGRVGIFGSSYDGQAAELVAALGNPHVVAVAALFSPLDPYRELFYPGGCATGGRFARWMCESQVKDGVAGALERLSGLTGVPAEELSLPPPVKPVDEPDGPAQLEAAIDEHQANVDMHKLLGRAPFSDDRLPGLDWQATTPAAARRAIEATRRTPAGPCRMAGRCFRVGRIAAVRDVRQRPAGRDRAMGPRRGDVRRHAPARRNACWRPARPRRPGPPAGGVLHQVRRARRNAGWQQPVDFRHARHGSMADRRLVASRRRRRADLAPRVPQLDSRRSPGRRLTSVTSSMPPRRRAPRTDGLRWTSAGGRRTPIAGKRTRLS